MTLSQTCGVTKLHMSVLYVITVIIDPLIGWNNAISAVYFGLFFRIQLNMYIL